MAWITMAALALSASAAAAGDAALPDWMAGCWEQNSGDRWTEECWTPPRAGIMLGASRSGRGDRLGEFEATQIVLGADGAITYFASPDGGPRTPFAWRPSKEPGVSFYNTSHDYPQRIRYWREGEILMAEISMADGSKPMRWAYRRMAM